MIVTDKKYRRQNQGGTSFGLTHSFHPFVRNVKKFAGPLFQSWEDVLSQLEFAAGYRFADSQHVLKRHAANAANQRDAKIDSQHSQQFAACCELLRIDQDHSGSFWTDVGPF